MKDSSLNVFKKPLEPCSLDPLTGSFRDGCCNTGILDTGTHNVCAKVTDEFLAYTKSKGNDLTRDYPEYGFKGLKAGDQWCLCVSRWMEAYKAGVAPPIRLNATHLKTLNYVDLEILKHYALE